MFTFILKLCILFYLFYMIHCVHSMLQYNSNASIKSIQIPNKEKIQEELKSKDPLIITYPENKLHLTIQNMNTLIPGYIIKDGETLISLNQLINSKTIQITDNKKLVDDYKLKDHYDSIYNLVKNYISCDSSYQLSLYRGSYQSQLYRNYREYLLLQSLHGSFNLYLFNPKHESEIRGLELNTIKKWGIRLTVTRDTVVFIPTEWSYFYELDGGNEELILLKIECDSIPTWLFNRIRRK